MEKHDHPVEQNEEMATRSPPSSATPGEETECSLKTPDTKSMETNADVNVPDTSAIKRSKKRKPRRKRGASSSGKNVADTPDDKKKEKRAEPEANKGSLSKSRGEKNSQEKNKIEGLIFMCNSKTKEDCFQFHVMGMTMNRKDTVLSVKPGMKLFLYDYDLKLLYGIYRAKSVGQKNIETRAFGGAFPYQVRFSIDRECFPIADTVFQLALRRGESSAGRKKFDVELDYEQVKNLCKLFKRIHRGLVQAPPPLRPQPKDISYARDVYEVVRDTRLSDRKVFGRAEHTLTDYPRYPRDVVLPPPQRDDYLPRDVYVNEKPRAYHLPNPSPPRHLQPEQPNPDLYSRELERDYLVRHQEPVYRDPPPLVRQPVLVEPLRYPSSQRELQAYEVRRSAAPLSQHGVAGGSSVRYDSRSTTDPYHSYPYAYSGGAAHGDSYSVPQRREEVASASYYLDGRRDGGYVDVDSRRRDIDALELRPKYAADPAPAYYDGVKSEAVPSSRYSLARAPLVYR